MSTTLCQFPFSPSTIAGGHQTRSGASPRQSAQETLRTRQYVVWDCDAPTAKQNRRLRLHLQPRQPDTSPSPHPPSRGQLAYSPAVHSPNSLGTVLGSTIWHSFVGGPIAYVSLPRQQFGHLQSRTFPRFFALQSLSALALLGLYSRRPGGGELVRTFWRSGNKTVWALVVMATTGLANWLVVGPVTTGTCIRGERNCPKSDF